MPRNIRRPLPAPFPAPISAFLPKLAELRGRVLLVDSPEVEELGDTPEKRAEMLRFLANKNLVHMTSVFTENPNERERSHRPRVWVRYEYEVL